MTARPWLPVKRAWLRCENGAGWWNRCAVCSDVAILVNGDMRQPVPWTCAKCRPGVDASEQAERCEREATQAERSAKEARRFERKALRDRLPGVAERNAYAAERAEAHAATLRVQAAGWRRKAGGEAA